MAKVFYGTGEGNQINVSAHKAQAYGLAGDDTIISDKKDTSEDLCRRVGQ